MPPDKPNLADILQLHLQIEGPLNQVAVDNLDASRVLPAVVDPFVAPLVHALDGVLRVREDGDFHLWRAVELLVSFECPLERHDKRNEFGTLIRWPRDCWQCLGSALPTLGCAAVVVVSDAGCSTDGRVFAIVATGTVDAECHEIHHGVFEGAKMGVCSWWIWLTGCRDSPESMRPSPQLLANFCSLVVSMLSAAFCLRVMLLSQIKVWLPCTSAYAHQGNGQC